MGRLGTESGVLAGLAGTVLGRLGWRVLVRVGSRISGSGGLGDFGRGSVGVLSGLATWDAGLAGFGQGLGVLGRSWSSGRRGTGAPGVFIILRINRTQKIRIFECVLKIIF